MNRRPPPARRCSRSIATQGRTMPPAVNSLQAASRTGAAPSQVNPSKPRQSVAAGEQRFKQALLGARKRDASAENAACSSKSARAKAAARGGSRKSAKSSDASDASEKSERSERSAPAARKDGSRTNETRRTTEPKEAAGARRPGRRETAGEQAAPGDAESEAVS